MTGKSRRALIVIFIICALSFTAFAEDVNVELSLDRNRISLNDAARLKFTFYNVKNAPIPQLNKIGEFDVSYLGPTTTMSVINGKVSNSISHTFILKPGKVGKFDIGPFSFNFNNRDYMTNKVEIEIMSGPVELGQNEEGAAGPELGNRAFLTLTIGKNRMYLNEIVPATIRLYLNGISARDIQYPEFDSEFLSIGQFQEPRQYQENISGAVYDVIEFATSLFATKTGELKLGPAELRCNVLALRKRAGSEGFPFVFNDPFFEDFFSDYVKYPLTLRSEEIGVSVLALPEEGRPQDFSGAIGDFKFNMEASPLTLNAGDPVSLKMEISGQGNLNSVLSPRLSGSEGFKVYDPLSKTEDGKKVFEQILIPLNDSINKIPQANFSYFDPDSEKYLTLAQGPLDIKVNKPPEEKATLALGKTDFFSAESLKERLGEDIIYIKDEAPDLRPKRRKAAYNDKPGSFIAIILPALALIFLGAYARRRRKIRTDAGYGRFIQAYAKAWNGLKKAGALISEHTREGFYGAICKTMRDYIGDRFHIPSAGITLHEIDGLVKQGRLNRGISADIKEVFSECDTMRYWAQSSSSVEEMRNILIKARQIIKRIERSRSR
ncbi:MAG: BatD family protein [Candidatus Omnitrophica bacterium]|nr:BatD family protein [Candidatus Omnitrophota bacterium]